MGNEAIGKFGLALIASFFQGTVIPKSLLDALVASAGNDPALRKLFDEAWAKGNQVRQAGNKPALDPAKPFIYSRGVGDAVQEEEFRQFLPEEKIIINQAIFRKKLENVDLANLEAARERQLIEELRQESIGLSKDDTMIYFNLLKIDYLARKGGAKAAAKPAESPMDSARALIKLVDQQFGLGPESLARLNSGPALDMNLITQIIADNIKAGRTQARTLIPYLGERTKYVEKFKEFLKMVVDQRDGNIQEILQYFGIYLLLNGTPQDQLALVKLSSPLEAFVTDKIGRVRQIYYAAMLFGYSMTIVLFAQSFELGQKYREMPEDQRVKLRKLYEAEDRLALLVTNAVNVATRRIAEYGVEAREIGMILKKFLAANKKLVTASDLFSEA